MAAGLGFKTFVTGEVLTAADTNGYLMQGINVFATTAARDAAITAPAEGQFAFTKDTNSTWYYDGAAWVASGASGDVTGVTAGTGITVTDPTGPVPTVTNSMATAIDAKGDLVAGTGADAFSRLAVGANDTVLTADSAEATGLKWATPAAAAPNGYVLFSTTSMTGAATITVSGISNKSSLLILLSGVGAGASNDLQLKINNVTGNTSNAGIKIEGSGDTAIPYGQTAINLFTLSNNGASTGSASVYIDGANSTSGKVYQVMGQASADGGTGQEGFIYMGKDTQTAAVTSIVIVSNGSNFDAGTMTIFAKAV